MDGLVKIRKYKISKRGLRGWHISIPAEWAEDNSVKAGDMITCFRTVKGELVYLKEGLKNE